MKIIVSIFKDILLMPYYRNYAAVSGAVHNIANHENAVEDILCKHGLKKNTMKYKMPNESLNKNTKGTVTLRQKDDWLNGGDHSMLPDNIYISQPCGTHNNPDFIVKSEGKLFFLECKSATDGATPVYNSSYALSGYIYIFSSKKYNKTTVFLGEDIVTPEAAKLYDDRQREHKLIDDKHDLIAAKSGADKNKRGNGYYNREMYNQFSKVNGVKTYEVDYFKHDDCVRCEERVLEFVAGGGETLQTLSEEKQSK
jgi:hypothetical protein